MRTALILKDIILLLLYIFSKCLCVLIYYKKNISVICDFLFCAVVAALP